MNQLSSVALILLLSLLAGHLVKLARIPEVTGYILAGIVVGPSVLGWIDEQNLGALGVFSEVALGLILFSIGSIFEFDRFRAIGANVLRLTISESLLVAGLVCGGARLAGQPWPVAVLLGIIGMETGAASTLMVLREYNADGPFTRTLTGVLAVNNVLCLTCFLLASSALQAAGHLGAHTEASLYQIGYLVTWQLLGSAALGYLAGLLLATWSPRVVEQGETLILLIGCILLCVGLALVLNLSALVVSLTLGATTANLSSHTGRLARVQAHTDPPLYAIFFVIAGANLHVGMLKSLGWVGLAYVLARGAGKLLGAGLAARTLGCAGGKQFGLAMLAHAGLAIGLVLSLARHAPETGPKLAAIVLGGILVYELIGPLGVRYVVLRADESKPRVGDTADVLE